MHVAQRILAQSTRFNLVLSIVYISRKSRVIAISHKDNNYKRNTTFRYKRYLNSTREVKD